MFTVVGGLHTDPNDLEDTVQWDDEYSLDIFRELYKVCSSLVAALSKLSICALSSAD